jgi:hypothetical protein
MTSKSKNIDLEIKETTLKLRTLLAKKKGIPIEKLQFPKKKAKRIVNKSYLDKITFRFQCPRCNGFNTKRNGTTTQLETKARYLCYDCQLKRFKSKDIRIMPFFVMGNNEMKEAIDSKKEITEEQRKLFYEKYLINL